MLLSYSHYNLSHVIFAFFWSPWDTGSQLLCLESDMSCRGSGQSLFGRCALRVTRNTFRNVFLSCMFSPSRHISLSQISVPSRNNFPLVNLFFLPQIIFSFCKRFHFVDLQVPSRRRFLLVDLQVPFPFDGMFYCVDKFPPRRLQTNHT